MAHFAKVKDGIVTNVIVAEQEFVDNYIDNIPGTWVQTSYNTRGGVHQLGGTPLMVLISTEFRCFTPIWDSQGAKVTLIQDITWYEQKNQLTWECINTPKLTDFSS